MAGSEVQQKALRGLTGFDQQTVEDLGFDEIRHLLEGHCSTDSARRRARGIEPTAHRPTVLSALESTDELRRIRVEGYTFPALTFEEIKGEIKLLEGANHSATWPFGS